MSQPIRNKVASALSEMSKHTQAFAAQASRRWSPAEHPSLVAGVNRLSLAYDLLETCAVTEGACRAAV